MTSYEPPDSPEVGPTPHLPALDVRRYKRRTTYLQLAVVLGLLLAVVCLMLTGA